MARHDVFALSGSPTPSYVIDVQTDLLNRLNTRVVVPLIRRTSIAAPVSELNPVFDIDGVNYVMMTQSIGTEPAHSLRRRIDSLRHERDAITRALDVLLVGF